jgi:succinate dehydrogenase / fumarate reductase cytochrome b subunit
MGVHLVGNAGASFGKVQLELQNPWALAFYIIGVLCASVHLSYGLWLFAAKWGITTGPKARRRFAYACAAICLFFLAIGYAALYSFLRWPQQPVTPAAHVAEQARLIR